MKIDLNNYETPFCSISIAERNLVGAEIFKLNPEGNFELLGIYRQVSDDKKFIIYLNSSGIKLRERKWNSEYIYVSKKYRFDQEQQVIDEMIQLANCKFEE